MAKSKYVSSCYISGTIAEAIWPEIFHQDVPSFAQIQVDIDKETPIIRLVSATWPDGGYRVIRRDNVTARING